MIWNYVEIEGLVNLHVSLHVVFRNLVALVITCSETTWGYWELQVFRKLKHRLRHYIVLVTLGLIHFSLSLILLIIYIAIVSCSK